MTARCPRLWEVEAARDSRLSGTALAAHDAHVTACRECNHEREAFDALARDLRASDADGDEVSLRRLRQTTLERAFDDSGAPSRTPSRVRIAALGVALLGVAVFAFLRNTRVTQAAPSIAVTAGDGSATWTRHSAGGVEQIDLGDGAFSLVVRRRPSDARVIVRVPEGEIEDFGTRFDVSVRAGRTQRIAVREGSVAFRRPGKAPLRLSAGMVWSANDDASALVATAPIAVMPKPEVAAEVPVAATTRPPVRVERAERVTAAVATAAAAEPMRASLPATSAEDAAYLHVLALLREGRDKEARLAAALYVQRFPNGFRHPEMQRVAQRPAPQAN